VSLRRSITLMNLASVSRGKSLSGKNYCGHGDD
jgi:hypothetical protein